jgi:hypothetical protein
MAEGTETIDHTKGRLLVLGFARESDARMPAQKAVRHRDAVLCRCATNILRPMGSLPASSP